MNNYFIAIIFVFSAASAWAVEGNPPITKTSAQSPQASQTQKSEARNAELVPLPQTQLFKALRADPKEPRFFVSSLQVSSNIQDTTIAAVGFGEHFGIIRYQTTPRQGWQLALSGGVFAQFDVKTESDDLMNADYVIGFPVTWRQDDWSGRLRIYHQSSHLGDEFLLRVQPQRVNLSFESIELLLAYDIGAIRVYGGGEYLFHREPKDLAEQLIHVGADWRNPQAAFHFGHRGAANWVAGFDVKRWHTNDWSPQISIKAGLEFAPLDNRRSGVRHWNLLLEFYDGSSPYGQFYQDDLRYWGVSLQLAL